MRNECKIGLEDTMMSSMLKMAEGNPGAAAALADLTSKNATIDPQDFAGPLGPVLSLDSDGIYGTEIYVLYNDKCGRDARRMLMLLRAVQLGLFSRTRLKEMAEDQKSQVNLTEEEFQELDKKVCDRLESFQKPE